MCKQALTVCLGLGMVFGLVQVASADLVGHWALDDGAGTIAADSSGNGHDAVVEGGGDAAWVEGQLGSAVEVGNGVWVNVPPEVWAPIDNQFTVAYWSFGYAGLANNWGFFATAAGANRMISNHLPWGDGNVYYDTADAGGAWEAERISQALDPGLATGVWNHWAFTKNADTGDKKVYLNGEVWLTGTNATGPVTEITVFTIGSGANGAEQYLGQIDDFQLHDVELTQEEIKAAMRGVSRELASVPTPEDAQIDVLRNVILSWTPGELAATHDVYLGTVFTDVNEASAANDLGVLVSQGQADSSYDAGILEFGQTYFWRVDEVNGTPDQTVFKGEVWSFTAEPYSIQIPGSTMVATASSQSNEFSTPDKIIDGSGLGADGTHSIDSSAMWFTAAVDLDPWIQFDFDDTYKMDVVTVWNSNSAAEAAIGWGVKDLEIQYSVDGETWDVLPGPHQLSRASGSPTYNQYDTVPLDGVAARYVRLNIQSNWGGLVMSYGLSEVQFTTIPAQARTPEPAVGSVDVVPNATISWRAGREAAQHIVYTSTDVNAVIDGSAPSVTTNANSLSLSEIDAQFGQTYYWRVDEVNETEAIPVWAGPVWNLNTATSLVVDDFESYNNFSPDRPFQTWLDGFGYSADEFFPIEYPGNGTGAGIGHDIWSLSSPHYDGDIMETSNTIAGSGQSMPFYYTNTGGVASQTERTFTVAQDWTVGSVKTLSLAFFGASGNTGQLYIKINGTKVPYDMAAEDIALAAWQAWNIDLSSLGLNLQNITKFEIGVDGSGASGMVLIDDITLHAAAGELISPVDPGTASVVSTYHLDGDFSDSTGNRNGVPMGTPQFVTDPARGQVLSLDGASSAADVPHSAALNPEVFSASLWVNADPIGTGHRSPLTSRDDGPARGYIIYAEPGNTWQFWIGTGTAWSNVQGPAVAMGEWAHLTVSYANEVSRLYVNGFLAGEQTNAIGLNTAQPLRIGGGASEGPGDFFFVGMIDEINIYNSDLSDGEVLWLSGRDAPIHKPF